MSKIASARVGDKNPFYGKHHTQETKDKLSKLREGNKPPNMQKVLINDIEYESVTEASRQLNVCPSTMIFRIKSPNPKFQKYFYIN